jgi:hypothetical protein
MAVFYCVTDHEAVGRFRPPPRDGLRAELWQGGRFIAAAGRARRPVAARPYVTG